MVYKRHNPGFTLIEILVVVAVIVVLAGALWKMGHALEAKGLSQQQKEAFTILDSALQEYYGVAGLFPVVVIDSGLTDPNDVAKAGTESMWQQLLAVPESRFVAERLSRNLWKNRYKSALELEAENLKPGEIDWPEIYDVWGRPIQYVWHANMAFPLLRSRGPNGDLEDPNALIDDVTNR